MAKSAGICINEEKQVVIAQPSTCMKLVTRNIAFISRSGIPGKTVWADKFKQIRSLLIMIKKERRMSDGNNYIEYGQKNRQNKQKYLRTFCRTPVKMYL